MAGLSAPARIYRGEPLAPGVVLAGRYRLIARLGEGEQGSVWCCHDQELDEQVAIKLLGVDAAEDGRLDVRLRGEVRRARRVTHPNIARVFELGRCEDCEGLRFLTMEYIVGETLGAWLDRGERMRPAWVQALAVSLCRGLAAALAVGVVHGAIGPRKILLSPGRGVVLLGCGIARAPTGLPVPARDLPYFAPERLFGGEATPSCDVFSVGVVLFEALTGRLPWPGGEGTLEALFQGGEPRVNEPGLPGAWVELLRDCLRFDPRRRPADVRALLVRLGTPPARDQVSRG